MIMKRDQDILNFIYDFHIATSEQIFKLYFNNKSSRYCRKRLKYLYENGFIKRTRSTINNEYAYYIEKKSMINQIHHDLIRSELYTNLISKYTILEWNNEMPVINIRPDAMCFIKYNNLPYPVFVEIHLNNQFNFSKYNDLIKNNDLKSIYGIMPRVIICTDRQITIPNNLELKCKIVDLQMNGLNFIFK